MHWTIAIISAIAAGVIALAGISAMSQKDVAHDPVDLNEQLAINATEDQGESQLPISGNIEKHGRREFFQDESVIIGTNITVHGNEGLGGRVAWPSIGPNYVISGAGANVIFDYYKSLGIGEDWSGIEYDEAMEDLPTPPALSGRYFGFEWNQTAENGTRVDAGRYQVTLAVPVMVGSDGSGPVTLRSGPDYFVIREGKPEVQAHNITLQLNVSKTELMTGEAYSFSLYLINNANHSEMIYVDGLYEDNQCLYKHAKEIHSPTILPAGGRIDLATGNNQSVAPREPGIHHFNDVRMLSIQEKDRVECLRVDSNAAVLNVTAPTFEGVRLVVETDKQTYSRNESIVFDLYIVNDSGEPFKLQEVHSSLLIRDVSGKEISMSYIADYSEYPTIEPYSIFDLDDFTWDQTTWTDDGKPEPGEYVVEATFTYPYLKSDTHVIAIT